MSFASDGPSIHHLLFADDSLFLCKASVQQGRNLKKILSFYGKATGQCINYQKSAVSFGVNIADEDKTKLKEILEIEKEGGTSKYLGLPECFSGSKIELLSYLKERTHCRLYSWYLRRLSQGGKEVLLKSTASALPVFPMSVFKLPETLIKNLNSLMAGFWWSSEPHLKKIHWVSWDKLCLPKSLGGIGFKDLESFNQALLSKQAWKVVQQPECLLARFLKSTYFNNGTFLEAPTGVRPSFAWRSLLHGRDLLVKGLKRHVDDGANT